MSREPTPAQLRYLVAAIDHGSWTEAAAAMGVSASAFSQGIGELERRLGGVQLFAKEGRRRVPTQSADAVARHARQVLATYDALDRWVLRHGAGDSGTIRAGMIDTAAVHHFGDTLVRFRTLHPDVDLHLTVKPSAELIDALHRGELDVAVAVAPEVADGLAVRPVVTEPLNVYAPAGVNLGKPDEWGPWVGFPEGSRTRRLIDTALRQRGADYDVVAESSQPAVLREMVRLGMGLTVLVPVDAEREPHALSPAFSEPIAERVLALVARADTRPTPALERFTAMLVSEATIDSSVS